jgi:hypothetical protein
MIFGDSAPPPAPPHFLRKWRGVTLIFRFYFQCGKNLLDYAVDIGLDFGVCKAYYFVAEVAENHRLFGVRLVLIVVVRAVYFDYQLFM